jgi:hypothetical protein
VADHADPEGDEQRGRDQRLHILEQRVPDAR